MILQQPIGINSGSGIGTNKRKLGNEPQEPGGRGNVSGVIQTGSWGCSTGELWPWFRKCYFPRALTTTRSTIKIKRPAAPTAAAVSSPEIDAAIVRLESISIMMKRTMIPRGVRIMLMIVPVPLAIYNTSPVTRRMGSWIKKTFFPGVWQNWAFKISSPIALRYCILVFKILYRLSA